MKITNIDSHMALNETIKVEQQSTVICVENGVLFEPLYVALVIFTTVLRGLLHAALTTCLPRKRLCMLRTWYKLYDRSQIGWLLTHHEKHRKKMTAKY